MKILKQAGLGIVSFVVEIILIVILAGGSLFAYGTLYNMLLAKGDYLLFVPNKLNIVPALMFGIFLGCALIYTFFIILSIYSKIKEKLLKKNTMQTNISKDEVESEVDEQPQKYKKIIIYYIIALIIAVYCGMTSYAIFYNDSIKIKTPLSPFGVSYSYRDIKSIDTGINRYGNPYYVIFFNNGKGLDLFDGEGKNDDLTEVLIEFDSKFRARGVIKNVDKKIFREIFRRYG